MMWSALCLIAFTSIAPLCVKDSDLILRHLDHRVIISFGVSCVKKKRAENHPIRELSRTAKYNLGRGEPRGHLLLSLLSTRVKYLPYTHFYINKAAGPLNNLGPRWYNFGSLTLLLVLVLKKLIGSLICLKCLLNIQVVVVDQCYNSSVNFATSTLLLFPGTVSQCPLWWMR